MDEQRLERALRQGPGFATRYVARPPVLDESLVAQRSAGGGRVALLIAVTALLVGLVAGAIAVGSGLLKLPVIVPVPSAAPVVQASPSASSSLVPQPAARSRRLHAGGSHLGGGGGRHGFPPARPPRARSGEASIPGHARSAITHQLVPGWISALLPVRTGRVREGPKTGSARNTLAWR